MSIFDQLRTRRHQPEAPPPNGSGHPTSQDRPDPAPPAAPGNGRQAIESERLQRLVLEGLPAAVALLEPSPNGLVLTYGNPALFRTLELEEGAVLGRPLRELGGEQAVAVEALVQAAATAGATITRDAALPRGDRSLPFRVTIAPEFDEGGHAVRFICTALDLSDQRKAEDEARELAHQLREAAEANPDSFMIMHPVRDDGGKIVDFAIAFENGAAREMRRTYSGRTEAATLADMVVSHGGGELSRTLASYVSVLESGEAREDRLSTRSLGQDRWYQRRLVPLGDGLIVIYREITEHVREVEALALAEADRRAILDGLADMVVVSDIAGDGEFRVTYANPAYYEFFGFTPEGVIGHTIDEICSGDVRDAIRSASGAALHGPADVELPASEQGQRRYLQIRIMPVHNDAGQVVRRIWRATDVTGLRAAQTVLQGRESHYEAILSGLADLICVSEPAEDGEFRITYANPAYLEFMGVRAEQVIGKPRHEFQRPELYDLYDEVRDEAVAAGGPVSRDLEADINGRMRYGQVLVTPVFDDEGNCIRTIWRITDLTGQRESEAELDRAEAREQAILDGLSDFVYVLDRDPSGDFRFTHANQAVARMGNPETLLGRRLDDLLPGGGASARVELLERCVRERRPASGEFELDVDGRQMIVDICATPVIDDDGAVNRVIWRATDLTDRRASENLFRAAATANLDPFSHLEPVYDAAGEISDFVFRYSNAAGLELNRSYSGVEKPERLSDLFTPYPQGFAAELEIYRSVLRSGEVFEQELRTRAADGRIRWLFRQIVPVEGGVIVSGRDITDRKQRDEALARAERMQRTILEGLNDAIVLSELDGEGAWRVAYANQVFFEMLNLAPQQVLGETSDRFLSPERAAHADELRQQALHSRGPIEEENVVAVDGAEIRRVIRVTPILEEDGSCTRTIWRMTDVTEQRALETRFRAAAEANLDAFMIMSPLRSAAGAITDFEITFANGAARAGSLAYSAGRDPKRLSEMFEVAREGFQNVLQQYVRVLESREPAQDETWSNADGRDRWFQRQLIPFSGGLVVTYREVTETRQAHMAVAAAERNHRAILEGLADAVVVSDRDVNGEFPITYANPAFFRLLGISPDEIVSKGVAAFLPPEIAEAVVETRHAAIAAGGPIDREIGGNVRGRELDLVARITPVFDDAGVCIRLIWRLTDVGEARRQQRALEDAERNQRAILRSLQDGILVFDRDSEDAPFRVSYSSPLAALRDRYSEVVGWTFDEMWHGPRLDERLRLVREAIETARPVAFETTMEASDGALIYESCLLTPIVGDDGVCRRLVWRFTDITEAHEQREALEAAERNQRAILDALSDVLIVMDRDAWGEFVVTYINAAREALTGRPDSQLLGKRLTGFLPPEGAERLGRAIEQAAVDHRTVDFEGVTPDRNGEPLYYSARITPTYEPEGPCNRIILRYTDITAERRVREQFEESERNREAIVDSLADIVLLFDRDEAGDFRLSFANPPFFATGRKREETLGKRFEDFLTPEEAAVRYDLLREALATRGAVERELTVAVGERVFHYTTRVSPVYDADDPGACHRTIWRYTDITELVKHRERLAETERDQRAIIDGLSDALLVADLRPDGRWQIVHANAAHYELWGETAAGTIGRFLDEVAAFSEDAGKMLEWVETAVAARSPVDVEVESAIAGSPVILSRRVNPLIDGEGRCYRVIVRTTDVTEARRHDAMINRLGRIIDVATDEIFIVDAKDLTLIQTNAAARRNLGLSEHEAAGLEVASFLAEPRLENVSSVLEPLIAGRVSRLTVDGKLRRKDGTFYPVEADVQYLPDQDPPVLLAIARDVTERRALQASLSRMAAIVESSADAVIGLDETATVNHWNPAAAALFGHEPGEAVGRPLASIFSGPRWDRDRLGALIARGGTIDTSLPRADGSEVDVSLTAFPVRDPGGGPPGTAIIAHDIRWRLEATHALRQSELRFRTVFDQAPSGILLQRASDGVILDVNQFLLDMVEFPRHELVGKRPIEMGLVIDPGVIIDLDTELRAGRRPAPREIAVVARSGRVIETFTTVEPIEINGEPCFLSFLADISQLRRAERELVRAQEGLRSITENLPLILMSWDKAGICTLAVGHGLELAGLEGALLVDRPMADIIGASARLESLAGGGRPGSSGSFEFSLAGRIFEAQYRVLPDGSGTVSVAVDVTEQRATLGQLEAIVENAPISLFALDSAGIVTIARGRSQGTIAGALQTALGRSIFELLPPGSEIAADVRRALAGEQFSATYQGRSDRQFDVHYSPVLAADGSPAGAAAVLIDVTERLRAERAIQESNERFRQIAETATDGIVSATVDGRIVFANAALGRIFGYEIGELMNQPLTVLMPHEQASAHRQGFRRYLDTGQKVLNWNALELTGRRRDGTDFQFEMSLSEGMHDGERVITAFIRDITERRRTEEALMQAQKLESLGILAGGIAHDFNNMLVAIMGNAGLALADLSPESPAYETVQEIELAARRAAELARQMLAYSGKGRLAISRVDLTALVREIPHLLRTSIGKDVSLRYALAENLPAVDADATQLRQVVMNLVINASDAIGNHEGVIAISTGVVDADAAYLASTFVPGELKPGTYCWLEVADTGSGMAPETLARIFDPFFTTKFTGKGLGLAAVLGIVRGHRGTLKVESTPGEGTTFRILLPVAHGPARLQPGPVAAVDGWTGSGLVLVVDDEESVRHVTARAIRSMGFDVIVAADGQDGVEQFAARHKALTMVLMDLTMPRLNGEAAAARMRSIDRTVPIVLMSGFDESEMATRFRAAGIAGFVQKPFEIRGLRDAVRAAVRAAR